MDLKSFCLDYILKNFEKVNGTDGFEDLGTTVVAKHNVISLYFMITSSWWLMYAYVTLSTILQIYWL